MSAPNLKLPTTITGFTTGITLGSAAVTNLVGIVTNDASSNKVIKVNSIFCSNISDVDAKI